MLELYKSVHMSLLYADGPAGRKWCIKFRGCMRPMSHKNSICWVVDVPLNYYYDSYWHISLNCSTIRLIMQLNFDLNFAFNYQSAQTKFNLSIEIKSIKWIEIQSIKPTQKNWVIKNLLCTKLDIIKDKICNYHYLSIFKSLKT